MTDFDFLKDPFNDQPDKDGLFNIAYRQFGDRQFTREADGRWFDEYRAQLDVKDGKPVIIEPTAEPWDTHSLARWADRDIPRQGWFARDWIPTGQVVGLYGRPGSRKSTLILQWMIAGVLGRPFGNVDGPLTQGHAYGLFCEDSEFEIARRARAMLNAYGASFADLKDCHAESLVSARLTTFVRFSRTGRMVTTPAWSKFLRDLDRINPVIVGLDTVPDFFGGNEINRGQVGDYCRLLDATAAERNFALVFSAHPSLRGLIDKSLASGSTGWEGKVRARMTLRDPTDPDKSKKNRKGDNEDDGGDDNLFNQSDRRVLTLFKSNYAKSGAEMRLVFRDGRFVPEDTDPSTQAEKARSPISDAADERTLLDRIQDALDAGTTLSNYRDNSHYAPTKLADKALPFSHAEAALLRLFKKKILRFDGKKRGRDRWIVNQQPQENT